MRTVYLTALLLQLVLYGYCQNNIIPPSPEVAALAKFEEIPVNLHTGVPNINVPLNSIKSGKLSLNLMLQYHSGIKVQDEASSVGLGWSLSGVGYISRSVMGFADDKPGGYFLPTNRIDQYINNQLNNDEKLDYLKTVENGFYDSQPDVYYFSVGGYSGKIVFNKDGQPYTIPHQNLKIMPGIGPMQTDPINPWWEIVTPDGTIYKFDRFTKEQTTISSTGIPDDPNKNNFVSGWRVSEIISSDYVDTLKFNYIPSFTSTFSNYLSRKRVLDPRVQGNCSVTNPTIPIQTYSFIQSMLVSSITHRYGKTDFLYSDREDLPGSSKLDSIVVYDHNGDIKTSYKFEYEYFDSYVTSTTEPHKCKRLKLLSVRETNNGEAKAPYEFFYHEQTKLPPKAALENGSIEERNAWMSQDHWGFFNGMENNSLIPKTIIPYQVGQVTSELIIDGGNRNSNPFTSTACLIKQIKYPSGGYSEFTFESHDIFTLQDKGWEYVTGASVNGGIGEIPPLDAPCRYPIGDDATDYPKFHCSDTVTLPKGSYRITINHGYFGQNPLPNTAVMNTRILKENGETVKQYVGENLSFSQIINLDSGTYKLMAASSVVDAGTRISIYKDGGYTFTNVPSGGARIAKIVDFDGYDPQKNAIRKFIYQTRSNPGVSSGKSFNLPIYRYIDIELIPSLESFGFVNCQYINLFAHSVNELGRSQGSHVGYGEVTIQYGENAENGSTTHTFNVRDDHYFNSFPFAPSISYSWQRGTLEKKVDYDANGGPVKTEEYVYNYADSRIMNTVTGLKTGRDRKRIPPILQDFEVQLYEYNSTWMHPDYSVITYHFGNNSIVTKTQNVFDNPEHLLVTEQSIRSSNGDTTTIKTRYPADYSFPSNTISKMLERHMHTPIIERVMSRNNRVISAEANAFEYESQYNMILPNVSYQLGVDETSSTYNFSSDGLNFDTNFEPLTTFQKYDESGNILELSQRDGLLISFIWGYNRRLPVAEITNASYNMNGDLVDIEGNIFSKAKIDELTDFNGTREEYNLKFLELRNTLSGALINTFTYDHLIGLTSRTDNNGIKVEYEYDELNRLQLIRDHEDNILQHYDYHYYDESQGGAQ